MEDKHEFTIERIFTASSEIVWNAWTDPELLKQWWGPNEVLIPECELDLRVGGRFYIVMEAGEGMGSYKGTTWPMLATFTTVEPTTRLSYDAQAWTEGKKEETTIDQTTDISLTENDGTTMVKIVATIHKAGPGAGMAVQGMQYGFTQQFDKLHDFLLANK